jgi:phospholipid/cholesterol/gamma-HCH transport system ATP-binding protein
MADEERNDPPWGRPLQPDDIEHGGEDEGHAEQDVAHRSGEDYPAAEHEAEPRTDSGDYDDDGGDGDGDGDGGSFDSIDYDSSEYDSDAPEASTQRNVVMHSPEGDADEPDMRVTGENIPDNIKEQTREGEEPYQWHSGTKRDHGSTDAIEFIDVKKSFGRNTILNGLNLGIPDNQISMILGPSGTGKSVCIKHMVGLLYPDEGDVLVHGESVPNMVDDELFEMRKKFGVLFQDGALFGSMNVLDNTAFPLRQHTDKGDDEILDICHRRLAEVGLSGAVDKMPNELSGGMRKRAGFARALVLDPDIVLFDEPDSGLDPVRTALLCELIQEVHAENGGAYAVITHDIMSARRVADYIAVLWKGRIVESGPASELFNSPNQFVRQFLSGEARGPLGME